jgi:hypothetical protein
VQRCRLHGGVASIGRHTSEDRSHSVSLALARAAVTWPHPTDGTPGGLARAETAVRLPNGRFAPNAAPRPKRDKIVTKALTVIRMTRKQRHDRNTLPVIPASAPVVPWSEKTKADRLAELADLSMEQSRKILSIELDLNDLSPGGVRQLAIVSNHALGILSAQIKVDEAKLRATRENGGGLEEFYQRNTDEEEA